MNRICAALFCLLAAAAVSFAGQTFQLHYEKLDRTYGPFEFSDGTSVLIGKTPFSITAADAKAHTFQLIHEASGKTVGPFRLVDGAELALGGMIFSVQLDATPERTTSAAPADTTSAAPQGLDGLLAALADPQPRLSAKRDLARQIVIAAIQQGRQVEGARELERFLGQEFSRKSGVLMQDKVAILSTFAAGADSLALLGDRQIEAQLAAWLFASDERMNEFANVVSEEDKIPEALAIVSDLLTHDPGKADDFHKLILALALVWDETRPPMHSQTGPRVPSADPDMTRRYEFFRDLYSTNAGRPMYQMLATRALMFVVASPVPVQELDWAREKIKGSMGNWDKKFSDIRYDRDRLNRGIYSWPHGEYTLASIQQKGGICVDQAYFAAVTARANGIPAIYFDGRGRRGPHAWFAHLKSKTSWNMDAGRYAYDNYATGFATDPQTNRKMTDHDVAYACENALRSRKYEEALAHTRIAEILLKQGQCLPASKCARSARSLVRRYERPWDIEASALEKQDDLAGAVSVLNEKAKFFSSYPDIETRTRQRQAELLRKQGKDREADRLLQRQAKRVAEDRDDISRDLTMDRAEALEKAGDVEGSRHVVEELLEDQIAEVQKLVPLMREYLALTERTNQAGEGSKFMKKYVDQLLVRYSDRENKQIFLNLLIQAHKNAGDDRETARAQRQLSKL